MLIEIFKLHITGNVLKTVALKVSVLSEEVYLFEDISNITDNCVLLPVDDLRLPKLNLTKK